MDNKTIAAIIPAPDDGAARDAKLTRIIASRSSMEHAANLAELITKEARALNEPGADRTAL